jgi:hypothetical protein
MQLFSSLPYKFAPLDGTLNPAAPLLTFIVKATFAIEHQELPEPADEQADFAGDEIYMDEIGRSLRYASDLALFKPFGEVLLTANCHAPYGQPATALDVALNIGPISKKLRVFGDRVWLRDGHGNFVVEGPVPFLEMPLRWERAFGGLNFAYNPMGRGIDPWAQADGRKLFYLANIEAPTNPVLAIDQRPAPECFAPIAPYWQPRLGREGTRDQHWATFVAPLPPRDYDARAAQAAPQDQWLKGYWKGDERIELVNMHPQHPDFVTALPGKRLRLFLEGRFKDGADVEFGEVELHLDTVHIDMTTGRMHLLWRRQYHPVAAGAPELESVYLAEEPLAEEPAPIEKHYQDYLKLKGPEPESRVDKALRDEQAALAAARKVLVDAKIDPKIIAEFDAAPGSKAKFDMMMGLIKSKTAELEAMAKSLNPG